MNMNTLICGLLLIFGMALLNVSAMSQIHEDDAKFHLYNTGGHEYVEPFEYAVKREGEHPGAAYVRVGRSHSDGTVDQDYGYGSEIGGEGGKASRVRSDNGLMRFGRSSLKVPHHKLEQGGGHGFERVAKSGGSIWVRVGRNVPTGTSDGKVAILSPNVLLERNAHCTKDLQQCYDKLAYVCGGDNNNNNVNGVTGDGSEDHLHRNNIQYFDASEGLA